ncbi:hypothetical protein EG68_09760 [Paragonimus skrjabini miyazakii]|uniref:Uncharacterized protein n=1 Tax=Paragonimus skrjabini miyazakii TaxID=59628 RepID=A0A8S9YBS2_9TREM|nr:hypothetical protein EG68_09760 [Paragonimus skrjabini miyazakii]
MIIRPSNTTVCTSATCDLPTLCRPSSLHSSSLPVKTVPFLPRVILSVQPSFPLSTAGSQTPFFQASSAVSTEAHQPVLSQQLANLHLPVLASNNSAVVSNPAITISNVQFCPLVLTATSKSQSSISISAPAPIHLQVASSPITSIGSSEVVTFSDKISAASSSPMPAVNVKCDGDLSPTITPTSIITSLVNKGHNQSTVTVASVVITPQCSGNMQSAFALRSSAHCTAATTNSVNPSSCSFLMDTSILGNQSSSAMHASHVPTPNLHTNATVEQSIFGAPFLPSQSPSDSRVLIQKPSNSAQMTQPTNSASVEPSSLTLVCASSKNVDPSPSASAHMIPKASTFVSDTFNTSHSLNSPKSKLVNLASSVTPNVRLLATSKPILTTTVSTASLSNALGNLPASTSPMKCSISNPVSIWSGVNNTPAVNPTNVFSVQTSHPLLVQTSSEAFAPANTADSSSMVTAVTNSLAPPSTVAPVGASAHLHGTTPTVLAFSLMSTTASSCNMSTTNFVTGSCALKQSAPTTSLVIRTHCNSTVPLSHGPSMPPVTATLASTSLLKPFSTGVTQNVSSPPAGIPTALPHIVPVSIAPAKFQSSAGICSTFSSVRTHPISTVTTARHGPTAIFSQTNRKRARKQQLASAFPNSMNAASPPVTVSSNSSGSNAVSNVPTIQQSSSANRSSSNFMTTVKSSVQTFQPTHQLHVTHSVPTAPTIATSLRPSLCSSDIGVKIACPINLSGMNTVNGTSSSINTTHGSFIGIRLVSVRANPVSAASNSCSVTHVTGAHLSTVSAPSTSGVGSRLIAINSSESSPLMPVPLSSCFSQCSTQFRITTAHTPSSELHPTQSATVYVLTSSAYPVVPSTTAPPVTITQSSPINTITADAPSTPVSSSSIYTAALMIPGGSAAGGMLQLRVRPPFSNSALITNASTSSLTPFLLEDSSCSVSNEVIHSSRTGHDECSKSHCLCCVRDALPQSNTPPLEMTDLLPVKQALHRTFITSSSSSLLHRHLLSPQNPIHVEPQHEQSNLPDKPTSDVSTDTGISDPCQRTLAESEVQFLPCNKSAKFKDQKFISIGDKTRIPTYKPMKQLLNEVTAAEEILRYEDSDEEGTGAPQALRLPRKQLRLDNEHSGKLATDVNMLNHGGKLLTESVLGVDPISGCEWVLTGLPTKPPITPRQHSFGVRTSGIWRPKSSHFLSASEIRLKLDSKFSLTRGLRYATYSKSFRHSDALLSTNCRRRRRRRAATTAMVDNQRITDASVDESATNTYSKASAMQCRLLHDLMTMRIKQKELQLLHFPLTASSVLSLTGWRALTCANNLDLLVYAEHQEILSLESLGTSLHDWLTPGLQHSTSERVTDSTSFQCIKTGSLQLSADRANPFMSYPHCDRSTSNIRYEPSFDRISTATTLSWSSNSQSFDHLDDELTRDLDKAFDLLKGISQRKRHLVKSIQHLQRLTRNIVDYFRPEAIQHAGDMDEQVDTSTSFSAYVKSPTLTARTVAVRRSTRNSSPVHLSSQPHDRSVEEHRLGEFLPFNACPVQRIKLHKLRSSPINRIFPYPANCLFPTTARVQLAKCFAREFPYIQFTQFMQLNFASVYVKQLWMK